MIQLLRDVIAYACLGLLVEVVFTGISSGISGDRRLTSKTYLWMIPVYGFGGVIITEIISYLSTWHILVRSIVVTIAIYTIEFTSGLVLQRLIGRCPWQYTDKHGRIHRNSVLGLIRLDYVLFWYILAATFDHFSERIRMSINYISRL